MERAPRTVTNKVATKKAASKSSNKARETKIDLDHRRPNQELLLSLDGKEDAKSSSLSLVRQGRFRDSYMMATNGGATYENALRPQILLPGDVRSAVPHGSDFAVKDGIPELQNVHGDRDDRVLITDTSQIPARCVGLLKILPVDNIMRYGTAWLIGPRTLATAAHNLIHPKAGRTRAMDVGLAFDGFRARGGWHRVVDNALSQGWEQDLVVGSPYDFAVIKIENSEVGNTLGWFGFADYEDDRFQNMIVNIFGYPMDLLQGYMYGVAGRILRIDPGRLHYDCDTGGGMSGAPVIARFGEQRIAVGIHAAGGAGANIATRINDAAHALFTRHSSS
jgi:V8-like Glu-specific endopeptidase